MSKAPYSASYPPPLRVWYLCQRYGGGDLATKLCPALATPWTVACQAPLSMGSSRQEYWSGLPFPSPGDLPDPGIEPRSPALKADSSPSEPPGKQTYYPSCKPFFI